MQQKRFYQKENTPFGEESHYVKKTSHGSKLLIGFFIVLLLIAMALGGLYFLGKQEVEKSDLQNVLSPTIVASPTLSEPTASPTAAFKREELSLAVLNGSGVPGAAGEISSYLKDLGYQIARTGNAPRFDYTGVTIVVSEEKKDALSLLQKDLEEKYASVSASISAELKTDAEVIIGK